MNATNEIKTEIYCFKHQTEQKTFTAAKIDRIALAALEALVVAGAAALVVGMVAFSVSPFAGFGLVPLVIAGGLIAWRLYSIKDYENPKELQKYRQQCQSLSLDQILRTHKKENVFKYGLISQEQFSKKFNDEVAQCRKICAVLQLEKKFAIATQYGYTLPDTQIKKQQIANSYQNYCLKTICEQEGLRTLLEARVLSQEEFANKMDALLRKDRIALEELQVAVDLCALINTEFQSSYPLPAKELLSAAFKRGVLYACPFKILEKFNIYDLESIGVLSRDCREDDLYITVLENIKEKRSSLEQEIRSVERQIQTKTNELASPTPIVYREAGETRCSVPDQQQFIYLELRRRRIQGELQSLNNRLKTIQSNLEQLKTDYFRSYVVDAFLRS